MIDWESKTSWATFKAGKSFVRIWDKEVCQEFLECCDKRGIKWQDGKKATEYNPFKTNLEYALEIGVENGGLFFVRYAMFNTGFNSQEKSKDFREVELKNLRKDDGRIKVKKDGTEQIYTFVQYVEDGKALVYGENGRFWMLNLYELKVIT